ncbi:MAG: uroporphyrinogen decarboxylase family protein [Thermoguttaceae bacterium]|jgi:uroporphyrinogen decarboxylase
MTDSQWLDLLKVIDGDLLDPLPAGLIIDSPWLPGWAGVSIMDYFSDDRAWLQSNLKAARQFERIMFLPGFWAEYGMCTEPSAFGSKCIWHENDFPSAGKMLFRYEDVNNLTKPNCRSDGLLPFVIKRLRRCRGAIEDSGHRIRFAVSRGPLNVASYLLGHTELLLGLKIQPEEIHKLLSLATDFIVDWLVYQAECFDTIGGVFILDDLIGFLGDNDFQQFVLPYFKKIFSCLNVPVRMLHNDAAGLITARYLSEMGVNVFNFSFKHSLDEIRRLAGQYVVLLGNIPPRDVMAQGTPEDVRNSVIAALASIDDKRRLILSCGGGMPPQASTANVQAFIDTIQNAGLHP